MSTIDRTRQYNPYWKNRLSEQEEKINKEITQKTLNVMDWKLFETMCADIFKAQGFEALETPIGADGGIDIIIKSPGLEASTAVQCKAWEKTEVGVETVRALIGSMKLQNHQHGIIITTSNFTKPAQAEAQQAGIRAINGESLLEMINKLDQDKKEEISIKVLQSDYKTPTCPKCGIKMKLIDEKKGGIPLAKPFWGCRKYPKCRKQFHLKHSNE